MRQLTSLKILNVQNNIPLQFILFAAVGAIGTAVQYCILIFLVQVIRINPIISSSIGFSFGALVNYNINYRITFRSRKRHSDAGIKYSSIALIGLSFNTFFLWCLFKKMEVNYLIAQAASTILVLIWNFCANRLWTFGGEDHINA